MKRTEITYRVVGKDAIQVIDFKNVASEFDILDEFGKSVYRMYIDGVPRYELRKVFNNIHIIGIHTKKGALNFQKNQIYTKKEFGERIVLMKSAGDKLQKIVKAVKEAETKTVLI